MKERERERESGKATMEPRHYTSYQPNPKPRNYKHQKKCTTSQPLLYTTPNIMQWQNKTNYFFPTKTA